MRLILAQAIYWFSDIIVTLMVVRAILSWFQNGSYGFLYKLYSFTINLTEPIVAPCRNLLSRINTGPIDFSLLLAVIVVELVTNILINILL